MVARYLKPILTFKLSLRSSRRSDCPGRGMYIRFSNRRLMASSISQGKLVAGKKGSYRGDRTRFQTTPATSTNNNPHRPTSPLMMPWPPRDPQASTPASTMTRLGTSSDPSAGAPEVWHPSTCTRSSVLTLRLASCSPCWPRWLHNESTFGGEMMVRREEIRKEHSER